MLIRGGGHEGDDMWENQREASPRGGVAVDGGGGEGSGGSEAVLSHKMPCCHLKSTPELPALIKFVTIVTIMPAIPPVLFVLRDPKT